MSNIAVQSDFQSLDPDTVIRVVEDALRRKMTAFCRPYASYINRVYELRTAEDDSVVAKFYRPGRWSVDAIREEHAFLLELAEAEIPVIAPLRLEDGNTLCVTDGMCFALFPKKGGRSCDEFSDDDWLDVGRLVGRVHQIGASRSTQHRVKWHPETVTRHQVEFVSGGDFVPAEFKSEYREIAGEFISLAVPYFEDVSFLRIHGDFHFANLIHRPGESYYMIDFDDMAVGPAIQDLWLLLPGYRSEVQREINLFAEGYESFREFPYSELRLIEILRAMRYIHFCAWCAHQVRDDGFLRDRPNWGTATYWRDEMGDLRKQIVRIRSELNAVDQAFSPY